MPALPFGLTHAALAAAMAEPDPDSLAAATRLRQAYGPELAAAALSQAALRRAARRKFGAAAEEMFFTRAGLEQATRPEVADHRARRFVAAGAKSVVDLGCGIGSDALGFVRAGLSVIAVDRDPVTAAVAAANLEGRATLLTADAEQVADDLLTSGTAVFCDPARRTDQTRLWRVEDFSPAWSLVGRLLDGTRTAGIKLGPALPSRLIPDHVEAEWFTHRGDTVEVALCAGPGAAPGVRAAVVGPDDRGSTHRFTVTEVPELPVRALGRYV
ncbi:MAG TPA: class I SAM-dependent methyltransferase, partial [Pseudonocardia sp.]|nr:class I SAM-dependent methyltransferase [Pseudonocardia sp.]